MLMIVSVVVAQESDVAEKLKGGPRGLCDGSTVQGGGGSFKKRKTIAKKIVVSQGCQSKLTT